LDLGPQIFAIKRSCKEQILYAVTNISSTDVPVSIPAAEAAGKMTDLISGESFTPENIVLSPYQYIWLIYPQ
jgi:hypothetical protein